MAKKQNIDNRTNVKHDLTGCRFGRLVVIERSGHIGQKVAWLCQCDCGNEKRIRGEFLRRGLTRSCGCLHKEKVADMGTKNCIHGDSRGRLYRIWHGMKNRCNNLNDESHAKDYSARGITYCNQWENYEAFQEWALSNGYKDALTLDRIDVNGNYEPNNCRWTTMKIQQRNKRNNRIIEFNGNSKTLAEWSEVTGLSVSCIRGRLIHGWTVQDALTTKSQR